jgi:uncharacterized protein YdiU (UPF0061 family)
MGMNYIDQIQARYAYDNYVNGMAVQQLMADAAVIGLNRAFGFGPVRAAKFLAAMAEAAADMSDLIIEDTNDTEYSRTKIDNELRSIVGEENFTPWEERYKAAINPNRGNREQRRARKKRSRL